MKTVNEECCTHTKQGDKIALILYFIGLGLFGISFIFDSTLLRAIIQVAALLVSGYHVLYEGFVLTIVDSFKQKRFIPSIHILMALGAAGALILQEFVEATLLILIFAGAHFLEHFAED